MTVDTPIRDGRGRVAIGDGSWPARGEDADEGTKVTIVSVDGGVVVVEREPSAGQAAA